MSASRVFVSHSSSDADLVRRLREALEPHGVDLWIDRRELAAGDALDPEIGDAIDGAAHAIAKGRRMTWRWRTGKSAAPWEWVAPPRRRWVLSPRLG